MNQLGMDLISAGTMLLIVAIVILLILYFRGVFREKHHYQVRNLPPPTADNFAFTVACLSDSYITAGQVTGFWMEADQIYAARLEAIRKAQKVIQFETYMMTPGRRADEFAAALAERAQAGVRVQLIADNYGSQSMPSGYWQRLQQIADVGASLSPLPEHEDFTADVRARHARKSAFWARVEVRGGRVGRGPI